MVPKILCVAEKPAIAKSVAQHLSGGHVTAVSLKSPSISMDLKGSNDIKICYSNRSVVTDLLKTMNSTSHLQLRGGDVR